MPVAGRLPGFFFASLVAPGLLAFAGCSTAGGKLGTLETQNRSLLEQNRVQLAEIENLKTHARRVEDKLIAAERQLAELERPEQAEREGFASSNDRGGRSMFDDRSSGFDDSSRDAVGEAAADGDERLR